MSSTVKINKISYFWYSMNMFLKKKIIPCKSTKYKQAFISYIIYYLDAVWVNIGLGKRYRLIGLNLKQNRFAKKFEPMYRIGSNRCIDSNRKCWFKSIFLIWFENIELKVFESKILIWIASIDWNQTSDRSKRKV